MHLVEVWDSTLPCLDARHHILEGRSTSLILLHAMYSGLMQTAYDPVSIAV